MIGQRNRGDAAVFDTPLVSNILDDEELLNRVLAHDRVTYEEAFKLLIARHGPMVLGVCRQILEKQHDVEDVFQATFLVLARNGASIRDKRALAGWLHSVANRLAVRAKASAVRRRIKERETAAMSTEGYHADKGWADLRPVLHEEVNRLPKSYRDAVVLCYLEGRTNEEAAVLLNWPVGTVKGRLSRARELLRSRLTRRGLSLSAAFLMSRLSQKASFGEVVSPEMETATVRAAMAYSLSGASGVVDMVPYRVLEMVHEDLLFAVRFSPRTIVNLIFVSVASLLLVGIIAGYLSGAGKDGRPFYADYVQFFGAKPSGGCHGGR